MVIPQTEIIVTRDGAEIARKIVGPGDYVIGREEGCELHLDADLVSRRHAQLTVNYDHALIEDLGSSNGTFVNGKPVTEATRLWPNQKIQVGAASIELRRVKTAPSIDASLAPSTATVQRLLPEELLRDRKYDIGGVIAQGGMGAILDAREGAIQRGVAMKVMLDGSSPNDLMRFIAEARITGQLEHPNIVPIHELGVDENGQVFYTMKMVRGITLKKILELLAEGVAGTVRKYPLGELLTVFQKVCDAVAFAHSKGVLHRDLKPENIMLGDFGEVLLMDWGLAKILGQREAAHEPREHEPLDGSASATMAGSIMGTPHYMSPEQARGEIEELDARTDIYALGAILYHLLALRASVEGDDAMAIVEKVARGEIDSLPSGNARIPDSLAAVVRKAMALEKTQRYADVADLQADLTAYQNGFATSAEKAGWFKRAGLAVKRNKPASIGVAAVLIVGLSFGTKAIVEGRRAEREAVRAKAALADLKKTAPALLRLAASEAGLQRYDSALENLDAALTIDPALTAARWRRGWVLFAQEKLPEASAALRAAADFDPSNRRFAALLPLVEKMAAAPAEKRHEFEIIKPIYDHFTAVDAIGEATPLLPYLKLDNGARLALVKERIERWLGKAGYTISGGTRLKVVLDGIQLGNLEPLHALPIDILSIERCGVSSFEPLRGMRLVEIGASSNPVTDLNPLEGMPLQTAKLQLLALRDLTPLRGMPLKSLAFSNCDLSDLHSLAGIPLETFECAQCPISDFSVLRGMPLKRLLAGYTRFADAQVLSGMPLEYLDAGITQLEDLTPLATLPLRTLIIKKCPVHDLTPLLRIRTLESLTTTAPMENLLPLRAHPSLKQIQIGDNPPRPVAEFWADYDAQQAAKK